MGSSKLYRQQSGLEPNQNSSSSHWVLGQWVVGLITLMLRSGGELTRVVGEVHHTASSAPWPWDTSHEPNVAHAPKPYLMVKLLLDQLANQIHRAVDQLPSTAFPQPAHRLRSAMNGVVGDKLHSWNHPLTQTMELVNENGQTVNLGQLQNESKQGVVLFVHGLCLSEVDWQSTAHEKFVGELRGQGFSVAWLRYNTGLPIWENGIELAQLLNGQWQADTDKALRMVGHSMGGLIVRSASYHGRRVYQHPWVDALSHAAYLASPHHGAPLEKIGDMANKLLGNTPYTKPFMALGNIRSRGIRSLRHGNITQPTHPKEHQETLPFDDQCEHFLLGALLSQDVSNVVVGDGLVTQASAMGGPHFPAQHSKVQRLMLDDVGHIRMLHDNRTYTALTRWFEITATKN